jgi:dihydrodipicolinate synthase/N-acetylneuraminate lyase
MKAAKAALPTEVALIAGTGYESTAECINLAGAAYVTGLQGVLVSPPQDNSDLLKHYQKIAEAVHEVTNKCIIVCTNYDESSIVHSWRRRQICDG